MRNLMYRNIISPKEKTYKWTLAEVYVLHNLDNRGITVQMPLTTIPQLKNGIGLDAL